MKKPRLDIPYNVSYTISFAGRTKSDGYLTVTSMIIRDKIIAVLEEMLLKGFIESYEVKAKGTKK